MSYTQTHVRSTLSVEMLKPFAAKHSTFIETGSNVGHGVQVALECGFDRIHSTEIEPYLHAQCVERFKEHANVFLTRSNSPDALKQILGRLQETAVIYLDAHSEAYNPLLEELSMIEKSYQRKHTILIDDVRMFGTQDWHYLSLDHALDALKRINPNYVISYLDTVNAPGDLLVAQVK